MKWFMIGAVCILAGCSFFTVDRPQVTLDYGTACLTYADTKAVIAAAEVHFVDLCAAHKLPANTCAALGKAQDRLRLAETYVRDMLRDPKQPVDWAKINQFLQEALGIAIKLGAKAL